MGQNAVRHTVLILYALIVVLPVIDLVLLSFKSYAGIVGNPLTLPHVWHWSNYVKAWSQGDVGQYLINTTIVSVASTIMVLVFASMAAYVIARFSFRGNQVIYLSFVLGLAMPITLIAIPLFVLMRQLNLVDNLWSLILVYSASGIAFAVFLLVNFIRGVPRDLEEAALIDGAGYMQIFTRIILPLIRPSLTTVAVFHFVNSWNGFLVPLVLLQSPSRFTVTVGVLDFVGEYNTQWDLLLPTLVMVMLPTLIVFVIASKQFVRNMTAGAVKL
ncbi:carbohydrate ABC transporter permease [Alicyclobacillus curvatus]|nr:carbohydrate ABC transporter permease [Alicyclobacillus curvatus]